MLEFDPPGVAAAALFASGAMDVAFESDLEAGDRAHDMDMLIRVTWPEIGRASRVLERLDREFRRAARTWQDACWKGDLDRDETVFNSSAQFVRELSNFPSPAPTGRGHLQILDVAASPLTVRLDPVGEVYAVLAQWPAGSVVFALASFGCPIAVERRLSGGIVSDPLVSPCARHGVADDLLHAGGDLFSSQLQASFAVQVPRSSVFRSVARHRDEDGRSAGEVVVALTRHPYNGLDDCLVSRIAMPD